MEQSVKLDALEDTVREMTHNVLALELALGSTPAAGVDGFLTTRELLAEFGALQPKVTPTADLIWMALFVHRTPLSEACRRVLTLFNKLGYRDEVRGRDLAAIRNGVAALGKGEWESRVYALAKLGSAVHAVHVGAPPSTQHGPYSLYWKLGEAAPVADHVALDHQSPHHLRVHVHTADVEAMAAALALARTHACPLWVVVAPGGNAPTFCNPTQDVWLSGAPPQPGVTMVGASQAPSEAYDWTRQMLEQRGTNFVAHTSLGLETPEQVASAWYHARSVVARTLTEKYRCLIYAGWSLAPSDIQHDLEQLLQQKM
jgi:hypothetical protein